MANHFSKVATPLTCRRDTRTQGGPVLADQPAVIDEKWRQADWKHGGREEEEQDVELRLGVWESVLRVRQQTKPSTR